MQTNIPADVLATEAGKEGNRILRSCVHCGFCTATCPTYQELGDELDGPRGRIYLIKDMLEGGDVSDTTQTHLDRCLSCRACETTCPSGVEFAHLAAIGKEMVEQKVKRPLKQRLLRYMIIKTLPFRTRFAFILGLGQLFKPFLSKNLRKKIPSQVKTPLFPQTQHPRKVLLIEGCVQPSLSPEIDAAAAQVLDHLSIAVIRTGISQCCGAVENHMNAKEAGLNRIRTNIDAWLPYLDQGVEAIFSTASACALEMKEYAYLLKNDPEYASKAARISSMTKDICEIIQAEDLSDFRLKESRRIAFHAPCTLQHGQQLHGIIEGILTRLGYELSTIKDAHLCCGSAGTYSITQPELSSALRDQKLSHLTANKPELIATANIGCLHHMQAATDTRITHWITLLLDAREPQACK